MTSGYFVIKFKNKERYITSSCFYTNLIEDALFFKTKIEASEYMKKHSLDKHCTVLEVK